MPKHDPNDGEGRSPSSRDPLASLRGDPSLDAVWRDILHGQSSPEARAALIRHYRAMRERHFRKTAADD